MAQRSLRPRNRNDFRVAIICALPLEAGMIRSIFDEDENGIQGPDIEKAPGDQNVYTVGVIGKHNVVLVHMPGIGNLDSATIANSISKSFPNIEIAFVVGICGVSPENPITKEEVVLGDCIVSTALIQYDFGRQFPGKFKRKSELEEALPRARPTIRAFLAKLQTFQTSQELERKLALHLGLLQHRKPEAAYPGPLRDRLFHATYPHAHHDIDGTCGKCVEGICTKTCSELECEEKQLVTRATLVSSHKPKLHFGRYGSASITLRSGVDRDRLVEDDRIIAFEMEGAGVWENLPTVIVKSACDYADSHKDKEWQIYAAATAAAGLKAILEQWDRSEEPEQVVTKYEVPFSLESVPVPKVFISRTEEMQRLEDILLPYSTSYRRKIFVLRGLGGIGKTQLAVEFMRLHSARYSAVFWLDGSSEDSLKQSLARHASRVSCRFPSQNHMFAETGQNTTDSVIMEFMDWLKLSDNKRWLMIFDNVDREHVATDPFSYDLRKYIPNVDHGCILITTRLARLERIGQSQEVRKVDDATAKAILKSWCGPSYDETSIKGMLERFDGLPLAIAQAGSYLHQTGVSAQTYLRLYDEQKEKVAQTLHDSSILLDDYPNRSVWTTWNISYNAILVKNKYVANLLVLWSFLDRNGIWFGLFEGASRYDRTARHLFYMLDDIASDELSFIRAMSMLRDYSLIEGSEGTEGYMMHTVVHRWIYLCHGIKFHLDFGLLALRVVGFAIPGSSERDCARRQRRLLPHVSMCSTRVTDVEHLVAKGQPYHSVSGLQFDHTDLQDCMWSIHKLGQLYNDQGKLAEAEQILLQAFTVSEKASGFKHPDTLSVANDLGILYRSQGRPAEAEELYLLVLTGYEEIVGPQHNLALPTLNNLGLVYIDQGKLEEAEQVLLPLLADFKAEAASSVGAYDPSDVSMAMSNLGLLYIYQGRLAEAEQMLLPALQDYRELLGPKHPDTLRTIGNLGWAYTNQGKLSEAEELLISTLANFEEVQGHKHENTMRAMNNLGRLYKNQGKLEEAEQMYVRALAGYEECLGPDRAKTYISALETMANMGDLYSETRPDAARAVYEKALAGYTRIRKPTDDMCLHLARRIEALGTTSHPNNDSAS